MKMEKIHWAAVALFDSDGGQPDEETHAEKMREYRDQNSIQGYWLVPPGDDDDDRVWDEYHDEYRNISDAGPDPDDIDWTGLD